MFHKVSIGHELPSSEIIRRMCSRNGWKKGDGSQEGAFFIAKNQKKLEKRKKANKRDAKKQLRKDQHMNSTYKNSAKNHKLHLIKSRHKI